MIDTKELRGAANQLRLVCTCKDPACAFAKCITEAADELDSLRECLTNTRTELDNANQEIANLRALVARHEAALEWICSGEYNCWHHIDDGTYRVNCVCHPGVNCIAMDSSPLAAIEAAKEKK